MPRVKKESGSAIFKKVSELVKRLALGVDSPRFQQSPDRLQIAKAIPVHPCSLVLR
jgi:hypothetical protein